MGLTPLDFFVKARFEPVAAAVLLLAAVWYAWSLRRLKRRGRSWPAARTTCFAAAWALLAVSVFSGLAAFGTTNFTAYGSLYIMVGLVAPALLAYSAPVTLALQSSSDRDRARGLETRPARVLASPFVTWTLFSASILAVFFTGVVPATVGGGAAQQAVFLWLVAVGWLFFWPVVDVDAIPRRIGYWPRILYLLLSFPIFAILGMGLESQSGRIAPGISLASLHLGGAVIWVAGETVALGGVVSVFVQWLRDDERRVKTHELANSDAAARQLALWRASRDAAARAASQ
jgi:cytochrome c oxidase assembly factor CtaG